MRQYVADAFTNRFFAGNPAAVCVLDKWIDDEIMKAIAVENNLAETVFTVKTGESRYHIRWFSPAGEVQLCGHATLATSFILFNYFEKESNHLEFDSLGGVLKVDRKGDIFEMDFPAFSLKKAEVTKEITEAFGAEPDEVYVGEDLVAVYSDESIVRSLNPDQSKLIKLFGVCQHATAPGKEYDCVSRSFGPKSKVPEDPVCGRGHCHIIPYFAMKTGKTEFRAFQASQRSGVLYCEYAGDRVKIGGNAVLFSIDEISDDVFC